MAEINQTAFAPAQHASCETLDRQEARLRQLPYAAQFLDTAAALVVILNAERQIIFASREFRELIRTTIEPKSAEDPKTNTTFGRRPGEALGCIHSDETPGGCGTTEFCRVCGAVKAVLLCQLGQEAVEECRMRRRDAQGRVEALDLRIWARPLDLDGERFAMLTIRDISDEKHRNALERIFFHDVLNTAGGVHGLARLLADTTLEEEQIQRTADLLCYSSEQLIEEIQAQRTLIAAEKNDLAPQPVPLEVRSYLAQIAEAFAGHIVAKDRIIFVVPGEVRATTDKSLLRRVVINLLKNALEASAPDETVTIDVWQDEQNACIEINNPATMSEDVKLQIFNRSFSTRGSGRGIGTYSAKLITERYLHGNLTFASDAANGTTFTISIPQDWPE